MKVRGGGGHTSVGGNAPGPTAGGVGGTGTDIILSGYGCVRNLNRLFSPFWCVEVQDSVDPQSHGDVNKGNCSVFGGPDRRRRMENHQWW